MKQPKAKFRVGQVVEILPGLTDSCYGRIVDTGTCGAMVRRWDDEQGDFYTINYKYADLRPLTAREKGPRGKR